MLGFPHAAALWCLVVVLGLAQASDHVESLDSSRRVQLVWGKTARLVERRLAIAEEKRKLERREAIRKAHALVYKVVLGETAPDKTDELEKDLQRGQDPTDMAAALAEKMKDEEDEKIDEKRHEQPKPGNKDSVSKAATNTTKWYEKQIEQRDYRKLEKDEENVAWKNLSSPDEVDPAGKIHFIPFQEKVEMSPRYDEKYNYARAALTRSQKFVPHADFLPLDELEKTQHIPIEKDPFAEEKADALTAQASMDTLKKLFKLQMKRTNRRDKNARDKIEYQLNLETARLQHRALPAVRETRADRVLIKQLTDKAMKDFNPKADAIIHGVTKYDKHESDKLRVTQLDIEHKVNTTNTTVGTLNIIREAQKDAAKFTEGQDALDAARHKAQVIRGAALLKATKDAARVKKGLKTVMHQLVDEKTLESSAILDDTGLSDIATVDGRGLLVPLKPDGLQRAAPDEDIRMPEVQAPAVPEPVG